MCNASPPTALICEANLVLLITQGMETGRKDWGGCWEWGRMRKLLWAPMCHTPGRCLTNWTRMSNCTHLPIHLEHGMLIQANMSVSTDLRGVVNTQRYPLGTHMCPQQTHVSHTCAHMSHTCAHARAHCTLHTQTHKSGYVTFM